MGTELRTSAPEHATGAVVFVPLDEIAPDEAFRLRPEGDVALLAASIGRLGQLAPVELRPRPDAPEGGPRWQVVAGFRRLAALRLLLRDRVLARVHGPLPDDDAWALALAHGLVVEPLSGADLEALRSRLEGSGVAPWALELVDEALVRAPVAAELRERFFEFLRGPLPAARPAEEGEEAAGEGEGARGGAGEAGEEVVVDADDFARGLALRMAEVNQELAAAHGAWKELPADGRRQVLAQARWVAELVPYLEDAER
jgi:ParB-like chromosome segregation protein Spo0J